MILDGHPLTPKDVEKAEARNETPKWTCLTAYLFGLEDRPRKIPIQEFSAKKMQDGSINLAIASDSKESFDYWLPEATAYEMVSAYRVAAKMESTSIREICI